MNFVRTFVEVNFQHGGNMNYGLLQYSDVVDPIIRFKDSAGNKEIQKFLDILGEIKYHSGFSTLTGAAMKQGRDF